MNVVMIVPTGIGCEIGGHAGDATPAARLLAACCEKLILHPNVVNASDINEMPANALYVEGSILDRFLEGDIELEEVKSNRILVAVNAPVHKETVNAVSAARCTLGAQAEIVVLDTPLNMIGEFAADGRATGLVEGWEELCKQVFEHEFDALAIATPIRVTDNIALQYFREGGINPWGGVEAKASKLIANRLNMQVAHAPVEQEKMSLELNNLNEIVDPRIGAEAISWAFLHCVLKGLHRAPRIGRGLSVRDVDCLVTPANCVGRPHYAAMEAEIPVIAVKENKTILNDPMPDEWIVVENYWEAAGILMCMKAGVQIDSVRRPLAETKIHEAARG